MRRTIVSVAVAAVALCASAAAEAHQGNPNMESVVRSTTPRTPGLSIGVLDRDDQFDLDNRTGKQILIYGYDGEQYARLLPTGEVQVNKASPAYYLNQDRAGTTPVPSFATDTAKPQWATLNKTGRFQWHDHRMHYMGTGVPPQVKDKSKRQKVFDYVIPWKIGDQKGAIHGRLFWTPRATGGGPPAGAIVAFAVVLLGGALIVLRARRRRDAGPPSGGTPVDKPPAPPERPAVEAW